MEATIDIRIPLTINQLVEIVKQLPAKEKRVIKELLNEESTPKEVILQNLKDDVRSLQNGTLQTRPAADFLKELKEEGYLCSAKSQTSQMRQAVS
ncbi:MAG: hypothetical protein ACI8WW_003006 [Oceanospirillaceae bacterium]|jgi:hypothetical protein